MPKPTTCTVAYKPSKLRTCWFTIEIGISVLFMILFGVLAGSSKETRASIYEHPELFQPPYSPAIKHGIDAPFITVGISPPRTKDQVLLTPLSFQGSDWSHLGRPYYDHQSCGPATCPGMVVICNGRPAGNTCRHVNHSPFPNTVSSTAFVVVRKLRQME